MGGKGGTVAIVPVSERAILARINRALREHHQVIRKARGERARIAAGDYFLVNTRHGGIDETTVNLEDLGRELGVLKVYEHVQWSEE